MKHIRELVNDVKAFRKLCFALEKGVDQEYLFDECYLAENPC